MIGGLAKATFGVAATASVTGWRVAGSVPAGTCATIVSGPLKPGPKPAARRS